MSKFWSSEADSSQKKLLNCPRRYLKIFKYKYVLYYNNCEMQLCTCISKVNGGFMIDI